MVCRFHWAVNSDNISDIMATLTVQALTTAGLQATYTAAAVAGDEVVNDGHSLIHVKNGHSAATTVTIASQMSPVPKGLVAADMTVEVTASGEKMIGFFSKLAYNDSSAMLQLTYTTHTSLTLAVISVT